MVVGPEITPSPYSGYSSGDTWSRTDEDGDELVDNLKRDAISRVESSLNAACDSLDAGPTSGMMPKSEMLTDGLGGDGKIWQSPLADDYRTEIRGIIDCITSKVSNTKEEAHDDYIGEPEKVKKSDERAKWGK